MIFDIVQKLFFKWDFSRYGRIRMNKPDVIVNMLTYSRISDKKINRMIVTVKKPLRIYGEKHSLTINHIFFSMKGNPLTNMQFIYTSM